MLKKALAMVCVILMLGGLVQVPSAKGLTNDIPWKDHWLNGVSATQDVKLIKDECKPQYDNQKAVQIELANTGIALDKRELPLMLEDFVLRLGKKTYVPAHAFLQPDQTPAGGKAQQRIGLVFYVDKSDETPLEQGEILVDTDIENERILVRLANMEILLGDSNSKAEAPLNEADPVMPVDDIVSTDDVVPDDDDVDQNK